VGQFDVTVDGQVVASRTHNVLQRMTGGGWPEPEAVVAAIGKRMPRDDQ
jgi:hypothetical protein